MYQDYNSRQRKIYKDYNVYLTETLFEMVKESDKYLPEVMEVVNDILVERKVILSHEPQDEYTNQKSELSKNEEYEQEVFSSEIIRDDDTVVKSFITKLGEKSDSELSDIVTKYIDYKSETVTAALILLVDRGLISYDLKGLLSEQIGANFAAHAKKIKRFRWESNNAFIQFFSRYQDDEIYNIIEDPKGIVIDVYHAVLKIAKERELITGEEFNTIYKDAKLAIRTEREIEMAEFNSYIKSDYSEDDLEDDVNLEAEKEKYWKCPVCNQLVSMELGVCWNCQAEIPQTIEHPDNQEIIKEIASNKSFSPGKVGLIAIFTGIVIGAGGQFRHSMHSHSLFNDSDIDYISWIFGGLFALFGIGVMIYGMFFLPKNEA
jgi:hypothetical protein